MLLQLVSYSLYILLGLLLDANFLFPLIIYLNFSKITVLVFPLKFLKVLVKSNFIQYIKTINFMDKQL